jgi:hypothetical protein
MESSPQSGEMFIARTLPSIQCRIERNAQHFARCGDEVETFWFL